MEIYAHTLFKNEERWLWYSVTSIINHVDKLLLWDTGSTDKSWEIALTLKEKYPLKIDLKQFGTVTSTTFSKARQSMLDATKSDWFLVVDADEIWWEEGISKLVKTIKNDNDQHESVIVPTINLVGDIFHFQEEKAGKYNFKGKVGHYNLRAINRKIPGLHSQGIHGVWGWADKENKMIQDRDEKNLLFLDTPYLHTTFLPRGEKREDDLNVPKRKNKFKYELGEKFPLNYYYPESFFKDKPDFIPSPWKTKSKNYILRAFIETPLKKIKRRYFNGRIGY